MGCAIGMSVAAACELIYWLTLKPVAKWMVHNNMTLTERAKYLYKTTLHLVFLSWFIFSFYQFYKVYLAYINREFPVTFWNV